MIFYPAPLASLYNSNKVEFLPLAKVAIVLFSSKPVKLFAPVAVLESDICLCFQDAGFGLGNDSEERTRGNHLK